MMCECWSCLVLLKYLSLTIHVYMNLGYTYMDGANERVWRVVSECEWGEQ